MGIWDTITGGGEHMPLDPGNFVNAYSGKYGADQSYKGQKEANEMQYKMFQEANAYSSNMDNTKYQRRMEDMKAAGLNPAMMMGQGGAGAPGTAPTSATPPRMGNTGAGYQQMASALQGAVSTALGARDIMSKVAKMDSETNYIDKQIDKLKAETKITELEEKYFRETLGIRVSKLWDERQSTYSKAVIDTLNKDIALAGRELKISEEEVRAKLAKWTIEHQESNKKLYKGGEIVERVLKAILPNMFMKIGK